MATEYEARRKVEFARGTSITYCTRSDRSIWSARVLCPDGTVRSPATIGPNADTAFSIPATIRVKGKPVRGFVHVETVEGFSTSTDSDPSVAKFSPFSADPNRALVGG